MSGFRRLAQLALASIVAGALLTACTSKEERIQEYYERGLQLVQDGEIVKAGLEFRNALSLDNDNVPALYALADVEQRQGRIDRAAGFYQKLTELDPKHVDARVRLGHIVLAAGAIDQAAKLAREAMVLDANRADVLLLNAAVAFKKRDFDEAVRLANAALKIDPKSPDAMMILAAIRLDSGDAPGALAYLDGALKEQPTNVSLNLFKIRVLEELGDKPGIEKLLVGLSEMVPEYLPTRLALVQWYASSGNVDKAVGAFRHLVDEQPANVDLALNYVDFLRTARGVEAARSELERRLKQPEASYRYTVALARLDFGAGRQAEAMDRLRQFAEKDTVQSEVLDVKAELARMLLASNDKPAATELVEAVLKVDERHVAALTMRATIRLRDKDVEGAIADLRTALNEAPKSPQVNLILAEAYEMAGHLELAEERLAEVAAAAAYEPSSARPYLQFLWRYQKLDRVEDVLTEVLARSPSDVEALKQLADLRLRKGDWTGAQEIADAIRKAKDVPAEVADQIAASALYGQKQYDAGLALLKNVQDNDASGNSLAFLVRAYLAAGKVNDAEALLTSIVEKNPKDAEAYALLGSVSMAKGDTGAAKADFERALELQPDAEGRYQALANFHARTGDLAGAEEVVKQGLARLPKSTVLQISRAGLSERKGEFEAAIQSYEGALETDPLSLVAVNNLASLLAEYRTDPQSLERAYTLSRRLKDVDNPFFQDTVGWVHYRRGEYQAAEDLLAQAAKGLPKLAIVHYHLGRAQQALGDKASAVQSLQQSLGLADDTGFPQKSVVQSALDEIAAGGGAREGTAVPANVAPAQTGSGNG